MAASTITEEEVEAFLIDLRTGDVDKKVNLVTHWGLKLEGVTELPERTVDAITLLVGPFVRSSAHLLVSATLNTFLPLFLPLIPVTPALHLKLALSHMLPGLIEKLNDPKERLSGPARECLGLLGGKAYGSEFLTASQAGPSRVKDRDGVVSQWELAVKDALSGRAARAKIEILKLLLQMRNDPSMKLPLKPWLASLVNLLEDSDGAVRDQARETVVALLSPSTTPPAARTEFKKLMFARNVRKSIADGILARVLGGPSVPPTPSAVRQAPAGSSESTRAPTPANEDVEIVYIAGARDLELEFKAMIPHFAGKETEHNWGPRERALVRIRGMLRGQVFAKHPDAFVAGLKGDIIDGVSRTLTTLRTTLAQQSCALVQELAETLGPSFDPSAEVLLPTLWKMAGLTKRMIAERSQAGVAAIIKYSTVQPRILLSHINAAISDKSAQTRQYGVAHLRTFIESPSAKNILHDGLLDQAEQMVKRCLSDINPAVREQGRITYWSLERIFPQPAAKIMSSLDGSARKQLERANQQRHGNGDGATPAVRPSPKPRASSAMSAMIAAKRVQAAAERASATATPTAATLSTNLSEQLATPHGGRDSPVASPSPKPHREASGLPATPISPEEPRTGPSQRAHEADTPGHTPAAATAPRTPGSPATSTRLPRPVSSRASHAPSPPSPISPVSSAHTVSKQAPSLKRIARLSREIKPPSVDGRQSDTHSLLEFDDDDALIATAPMTPARGLPGNNMPTMTPARGLLNGLGRREWEDSPMSITPKLIHKLEHSGYERSWWTARRKLLEEAAAVNSVKSDDIEADVASLDQPTAKSLKRIAHFSAQNSVAEDGEEQDGRRSEIWAENRLFDRVLDGLLAALDPKQPAAILEQALVTLWELVQNQWSLFEAQSREDTLLDRLFDLRISTDHTVLESTNAMISLLVEVCNPPFLLSQLEAALKRFMTAHQGEVDSSEWARVRTAGYTYAMNAMGMCILKLPKEAVEGEAKRRSHLVVESLSPELAVSSRQAGNRVILAVQCMLQDDSRTLDIFPDLTSTQRDFATYQMSQSDLLTKATEEEEAVSRRQSLHNQLVDGLAKGSRTR
ncbi:uncharacterized protein CcaverHIS019_0705190 [Cutaneotrichosporon cavernicola]|uniref:TOG domain-containing protein n=1 Tax=Cutaneotrichosporon cavernicola TaxID=279322 RepID=A0AA48QZ26_9TREE|nr:uncharacterized protein CcaverHIS019_0705190 [Cutaneotrichosporon cavernicola]BEI94938.1 hypothetical protein CcaverHIS019_0705190 [Cutaneotrichosporon cavernicola]